MQTSDSPTIEELEHAQMIAANVVAIFGDAYLPIFERVLKEIYEYQKRMSVKSLALNISRGTHITQFDQPKLSHRLSHILPHNKF